MITSGLHIQSKGLLAVIAVIVREEDIFQMYNFQQRETATILKRMTVSDLFLNDLTVDSINNHHDRSPIEYRFLAAKTYRRC